MVPAALPARSAPIGVSVVFSLLASSAVTAAITPWAINNEAAKAVSKAVIGLRIFIGYSSESESAAEGEGQEITVF
ncbi:hypothetical protein D3C84_1091350 [compost metagenome]